MVVVTAVDSEGGAPLMTARQEKRLPQHTLYHCHNILHSVCSYVSQGRGAPGPYTPHFSKSPHLHTPHPPPFSATFPDPWVSPRPIRSGPQSLMVPQPLNCSGATDELTSIRVHLISIDKINKRSIRVGCCSAVAHLWTLGRSFFQLLILVHFSY